VTKPAPIEAVVVRRHVDGEGGVSLSLLVEIGTVLQVYPEKVPLTVMHQGHVWNGLGVEVAVRCAPYIPGDYVPVEALMSGGRSL
jgi:hypothetical protein